MPPSSLKRVTGFQTSIQKLSKKITLCSSLAIRHVHVHGGSSKGSRFMSQCQRNGPNRWWRRPTSRHHCRRWNDGGVLLVGTLALMHDGATLLFDLLKAPTDTQGWNQMNTFWYSVFLFLYNCPMYQGWSLHAASHQSQKQLHSPLSDQLCQSSLWFVMGS